MPLESARSEDIHAGSISSQQRLRLPNPISRSSPPATSANFSPNPQPPSSSQLALTHENLRRWELSQSSYTASWPSLSSDTSMTILSASRDSSPTRAMDARIDPATRLNACGITTIGRDTTIPALQTHLSEVVKAAREAITPSVVRIAKKQPRARGDGREGRY